MIRNVIRKDFPRKTTQPTPAPPAKPSPSASGAFDLDACYRYCEEFSRQYTNNFPVASVFLPKALRRHVFALYAFVRTADDMADEPEYAGRRLQELSAWEDKLVRCYHGEADHPIFIALADTINAVDLPISTLSDLLSAFRMDLSVNRYATWQDLRSYLAYAAKPIGSLLLYMFNIRDADSHRYAEELSAALALANFWQDLAQDLKRDRVYIPQEDLRHFGVTEDDLFAHKQTPALTALVRFQCARTRSLFERAYPFIDMVPDRIGVEMALFWYGGSRALSKVNAHAHKVFGRRQKLHTADKALVVGRALAHRGKGLASRF